GESNRAIMPAIKPTMMILIMSVFLPQKARMKIRRSVPRSEPARHFVVRWQPSVRRQMVDDLGQMLAQAVQQILTRQAALRHHMIDLIGAERVRQIARRYLLVRSLRHPGIGGVA